MTKLQTITYSKTHLIISDDISFEEWQKAVETFARLGETWQWWLGDLLAFGETKWGEMYAQALDSTDMKYQTLANLKWVSRSIEPHRRREGLSWSHHSEVAGIDNTKKQDQLLNLCEKKGFSVKKLRKHLAKETEGMLGDAKKEENPEPESNFLHVEKNGEGDGNFPVDGKISTDGGEENGDSGPIPPDAAPEVPKIDLTDGTTKRNYEKMLKALDDFLRLRVPNMFLKNTPIEKAVIELKEMLLEAGK